MREHDLAVRAQREVPGAGELPEARLDLAWAAWSMVASTVASGARPDVARDM